MFAIRARKKSISEKDFMESVNKVREGGRKGGMFAICSSVTYFGRDGRTGGGREGGRAWLILTASFPFSDSNK